MRDITRAKPYWDSGVHGRTIDSGIDGETTIGRYT
jgi:hypothetical protein